MIPFGQRLRSLLTTAFCGEKGSAGLEVTSSMACCSGVSLMSDSVRSDGSRSEHQVMPDHQLR